MSHLSKKYPIIAEIKGTVKAIKVLENRRNRLSSKFQKQLGKIVLESGLLSNYNWCVHYSGLTLQGHRSNVKDKAKPAIFDLWHDISVYTGKMELTDTASLSIYDSSLDLYFKNGPGMTEFIAEHSLSVNYDRIQAMIKDAKEKLEALNIIWTAVGVTG